MVARRGIFSYLPVISTVLPEQSGISASVNFIDAMIVVIFFRYDNPHKKFRMMRIFSNGLDRCIVHIGCGRAFLIESIADMHARPAYRGSTEYVQFQTHRLDGTFLLRQRLSLNQKRPLPK